MITYDCFDLSTTFDPETLPTFFPTKRFERSTFQVFDRGAQHPGLWQRVRSELVLCLGLMHHLHLTGRQSLQRIADLVDTVTDRYLVFEHIDRDDANIVHLPQRRLIDYTLDSVKGALATKFSVIDVLSSDRPTRRLLVCAR